MKAIPHTQGYKALNHNNQIIGDIDYISFGYYGAYLYHPELGVAYGTWLKTDCESVQEALEVIKKEVEGNQ